MVEISEGQLLHYQNCEKMLEAILASGVVTSSVTDSNAYYDRKERPDGSVYFQKITAAISIHKPDGRVISIEDFIKWRDKK